MSLAADVGVVGAGPAGARVAELLASAGVDVTLLDPRAPWEKPCGGGLTPPAFDEMPELEELESLVQVTRLVRVETTPGKGVVVPLDRPIRMVSRRALARWQLDRARRAGARHERLKVREIRHAAAGWRLITSDGDVRVRFLVGADGAASLVRRSAAPDFRVELAPTRVAYPPGPGPTPDTVFLRLYSDVAGYLWDFPRPDHRSVGIMVPTGTWRRPRLDEEIDGYRDIRQEDGDASRAGAVIGTAQYGHGDYRCIAGADFALLGDAAGLADPLTGEGIHNALRSAGLFAEAWISGDPRRYADLARRALEGEFRVARMLRRHLFETGRGVRIIERGLSSRLSYAFVAACVNALNDRRGGVAGLVTRWVRRAGPRRSVRYSSV